MSVGRISSLKDDSHDLQKQIGCMNGIFQIFDRHHFLSGRRSSGHRHKRLLLQGGQQQQNTEQPKSAKETPKEKPRISTESSRESYSSSTCSTSTFSSMDYNRAAHLEPRLLRQINVPETTVRKEQRPPPPCKNTGKPLDVRDVVKDSVYRQVRGLPVVKSREAANEKKGGGRVLKHIDSPRPSLQLDSERPKPRGSDGGVNVIRSCREDRLALPRYSYDGRESRGGKHNKEHPRLSLDSKTSSMKYSALESRANFLIRDQNAQHRTVVGEVIIPSGQETGSHSRTSSLVAKLMGLETFPDPALYEDNSTPVLKPSCGKDQDSTEPARQGDAASVRKQNRKVPTDTPRLSLSVYGEIEKRITELEFKKSGKDLRALKQILEAMQKTRERLEESEENNSDLLTWKDGKSNDRNPNNNQRQLGASQVAIGKPAKVADKTDYSYSPRNSSTEMPPHLHRLHTREPRYQREVAVQKAKDRSPRNGLNDSCRNLPSPGKKASWRPAEMERTPTRPRSVVENCATSPRLQQNLHRAGHPSCRPTTPPSDRRDVKKCREKKVVEKPSHNRKTKARAARDLQASDDQFSEISSDTRYSSYQGDTASVKSESNNSLASVTESDIIHRRNYTSRTKKSMVESIVTTVEQPSPISVLDDAFYCEDSPSPVKKTSTAFQDDVPSLVEAEWHLEDMKHLRECTRSDMLNRKLESMKHRIRELSLLSNEPNPPFMNRDNEVACDSHGPDHRYINKVLLTSGLLKDSSFISAADRTLSPYHLINPDMFHVIEQTEEDCRGEIAGKKIQRKIIFDMVNEILIRKINSGRFSVGKKATSPQALLKEIYSEMDRARLVSDCSVDDGEDEITRILTADMKYQSEDWGDYKGEKAPLVLDVERLIFKDLINDVIIGEAMEARDRTKRHHRQLFRT